MKTKTNAVVLAQYRKAPPGLGDLRIRIEVASDFEPRTIWLSVEDAERFHVELASVIAIAKASA